jgi:hypothetical protein
MQSRQMTATLLRIGKTESNLPAPLCRYNALSGQSDNPFPAHQDPPHIDTHLSMFSKMNYDITAGHEKA